MKVRVPKRNFTGLSHGLKFVDGISENFSNLELLGRLVRKGYEVVEEKKPTEKEKLLARCVELGIDTTGITTVEKLKDAIKEKEESGK